MSGILPGELKSYGKNFSKRTNTFKLLRLQFKRKNNNLRRKRFWVRKIFMERQSKGEIHVLVKELKLFDHELILKHIAISILIFHSVCFAFLLVAFSNFIG